MSEYVPFEIQMEIIKTIPVKSVIQLRSVSKQWKSFIDSSDFISSYGVHHTQPHRLLVRYNNLSLVQTYVSFVDDDINNTFNQQTFVPTAPGVTTLLDPLRLVGSSRGLICFYGYYRDDDCGTYYSVLWNPSIRRSVNIEMPITLDWLSYNVVGFGVSPVNNDPSIVNISCVDMSWKKKYIDTVSIPWQVHVFTLSSGNWTVISNNLPRESISVTWSQVIINRFIYWLGTDTTVNTDGELHSCFLIVSFDLTTKEFRVIDFPDSLAQYEGGFRKSISKLRESLVVLDYSNEVEVEESVCSLWVMECGVTNSFTKLYTIDTPDSSVNRLLGFRKNGEPIIETRQQYEQVSTLKLYDPSLGRSNCLEGEVASFFVDSYMESLLLLDHKDISSIVIKSIPRNSNYNTSM